MEQKTFALQIINLHRKISLRYSFFGGDSAEEIINICKYNAIYGDT
jgi:hypothetical protein